MYMRDLRAFYDKWQADKDAAGDAWEGGDHQFVFHSGLGKPYFYTTPTMTWRKFLKRRGFRHVRLHDLRHSTGTLLLESGEDLKSIQHRLRHSRQETTTNIYLHVTKKMKKRTANKLEKFDPKAIRPNPSPTPKSKAPSCFSKKEKKPCISRLLGILSMERVMGIEPTPPAWEAGVLPLNYTRSKENYSMIREHFQEGKSGREGAAL